MSQLAMTFDGATYEKDRDESRLNAQMRRVWRAMLDGKEHTLPELSEKTGDPEASVSARLRDLRKARFGAHRIERRYIERGLWGYRMVGENNA